MSTRHRAKTTASQDDVVQKNGNVSRSRRVKRMSFQKTTICHRDILSTRRRVNTAPFHSELVSIQRHAENSVVSRTHRVKTTSCQIDVVSERHRLKKTSCQDGAVSTRHRAKTRSCQDGAVSKKRCRVNTMSCQYSAVSGRCLANTTSCQENIESTRRRVKTVSSRDDTVLARRHLGTDSY